MLEKIFGENTMIRVLETFLKEENRKRWLNVKEIERLSNVSSGTISRRIGEFVGLNILLEDKPSKRNRIFHLNAENKYMPIILEFYDKLSSKEVPKSVYL